MPTNLQPASTQSAVVLPPTGTLTDVESTLAYGIYTAAGTSDAGVRSFISGAVDQVAYVRFASVYRDFQDIKEFAEEISSLSKEKPKTRKKKK